MNLIRTIISVFLLALLVLSVAGLLWSSHMPPAAQTGGRVVLAVCGLSSLGATWLLWRFKQPDMS